LSKELDKRILSDLESVVKFSQQSDGQKGKMLISEYIKGQPKEE